jgi:hypothetical protein
LIVSVVVVIAQRFHGSGPVGHRPAGRRQPRHSAESLYTKLQSAETSAIFFKVFHDKFRETQAEIRFTMSVNTTEMASAGNNKLKDHSHEMKDHFPYDLKMKHQRIMSTRASNCNVTV